MREFVNNHTQTLTAQEPETTERRINIGNIIKEHRSIVAWHASYAIYIAYSSNFYLLLVKERKNFRF